MKIVCGSCAVCDLHVVLGTHLQVALESRRGMLRSLPLVTMGQQTNETGHSQPLALARRYELVEHHLCAVGEVAELRFPQCQRRWFRGRITVLESQNRFF